MTQVNGDANNALRARIRALLNKTTMNNCTEAEAMSAAAKARELMDKYQLELDDLAEVEPFTTETIDWRAARKYDFKAGIAMRVAQYCDCRVWTSKYERKISFFGRESDAMFATWLMEALTDFVARGWVDYQLGFIFDEDYACSMEDFYYGAANRICKRLHELTQARLAAHGGTENALVVNRKALVDAAFRKLGLALSASRKTSFRSRDQASMAAGHARGESAGFNRPVNGGRPTLRIGGK